jgi:c-di-GMP-binding flagellar brake protein YcgR
MTLQQEQRKYPRLSVHSEQYGVAFQFKGDYIENGRLANLSAGGCGLEVPITEVRALEVGDLLEGLILDHPDLPALPLSAMVVRMLGKVPGKSSGYVLLGLEFQGITPFVRDLIAEHVIERLAEG